MDFTKQKILVTGADGFIGSHLVEGLLAKGCQVRAFVFYNSFNNWGWLDTLSKEKLDKIDVFTGDVRDPNGVRNAMQGMDMVFHLAALIAIPFSYHSPDSYVDTNIKGTLNVLQAARDTACNRVIITSTSEVYGTAQYVPIDEQHPFQGQSPYSATKIGADRIAESFYRSFNTPVTIVRPFNAYGPRQSARAVIPTIISQLLAGSTEVRLGSIHPTRDFNYVKDTVAGFIAIAETQATIGEEINIASQQEISIGQLAREIIDQINPTARIVSEDIRIRPEKSEVERLLGSNEKIRRLTASKPASAGKSVQLLPIFSPTAGIRKRIHPCTRSRKAADHDQGGKLCRKQSVPCPRTKSRCDPIAHISMTPKNIHLIAAARPNFMKIAPLYHALVKEAWAKPLIVHTGQHYDLNMSDAFFLDLNLPAPHIHLDVGSGTHAEQTGGVMIAYEKVLVETKPDLTVVAGDVNSTVACTLAAVKLGIKVAHLEAGLRSFDRTMPEEINRIVTDSIADYLWTPSPDADANLISEGIDPEKITMVGNIMIDSLVMMAPAIRKETIRENLGLADKNYGVVTLHRPSNVDTPEILSNLCNALIRVSEKTSLVFPVHPRTAKNLHEFGFYDNLNKAPGIILTEPLGYKTFMNLIFGCKFVITDSGGIQEETTYLKIPCLTLRPNTERPVTVTRGTNKLSAPDKIEADLKEVMQRDVKEPPLFWDGKTATRVVEFIKAVFKE